MALSTEERAIRYIAKMPPAISGQGGHNAAFKVAVVLAHDFALTPDQARAIFKNEYNLRCTPPWSDQEIDHKLESASKANHQNPRGWRLQNGERPQPGTPVPCGPPPARAKTSPALDFLDELEVEFTERDLELGPFDVLNKMAIPLREKAICILNGREGQGKSYFLFEVLIHLDEMKVPFALLEMEKDRSYWLGRLLGMLHGSWDMGNPRWRRQHRDQARAAYKKHEETLDRIGFCIDERPKRATWETIILWMNDRARDGAKVLCVDAISVKSNSKEVFTDDQDMMLAIDDLAKKHRCAVLLLSHPIKTPGWKRSDLWGDDLAGGAQIGRMADCILNMAACELQEYPVKTPQGICTLPINRMIQLRKTRDGAGQFHILGYYADTKTSRLREQGWIGTERRKPKPVDDSNTFGR